MSKKYQTPKVECKDGRTYYNGEIVAEFIDNLGLSFNAGNVVKYLARAGKKDGNTEVSDLEKAVYYLDRELKIAKVLAAEIKEKEIESLLADDWEIKEEKLALSWAEILEAGRCFPFAVEYTEFKKRLGFKE